MKHLKQMAIVAAAACALAIISGCETPGDTALLGGLLGGMAPYAKTAQGAASMAAMGSAASGYANAQASQPRVTVNNNVAAATPQSAQGIRNITDAKMRDGSTYSGQVIDVGGGQFKPHGYGTCKETNGDEYKGEWFDGKRHGRGTYTSHKGATFDGEWKDGDLVDGTATYPDGRKYVGGMKKGEFHGRAILTFADDGRIEGEWDNGKLQRGTWTYANGAVYVGEFKDGKKHGDGKQVEKNGTIFEGKWDENQFREGVVVSATGDKTEGKWDKDGKVIGKEVRTNTRGTKVESEVRNGKSYSSGVEVWPDGTKFEGIWDHGGKSGGTISYTDGRLYKGDWKIVIGEFDLPDGDGTMKWGDGRQYVGEFRDGKMHGLGKMTYPDGKIEEGVWKQDEFTGKQAASGKADSKQQSVTGSGKQGTLTVDSVVTDCEVFVDGAFMGNTPAKLRLSEGAHSIEVKKDGYKSYKKDVTISEGSELTLRPSLQKE